MHRVAAEQPGHEARLLPGPLVELLPDDDPVVEGAAGEDAAKLGVTPGHLPHGALVARQVCEVRDLR